MSDPKRPSFRAFIRRLNPGKGNESSSDSMGTPASTPPVSQGRLPAGLPSASASSMSVPSVNVAVTKDPLPENVSVGCSVFEAEHGDTISTTDYECKDQQVRFQQLWKEAIDNAKASKDGGKLSEVIRVQEQASAEDAEITLPALIKRLETEMKRFGTQKRLAEAMERIVPHLNRFAVVGDIAVSTNPNPAALPWAANLTAGVLPKPRSTQVFAWFNGRYEARVQPPILPHILEAVKEDHSLTMAPIQIQWQKLILNPLVKLQDEGLTKPIVFVLDALDECDEQDRGEIFRLLLATCPGILRVFLTSRPELDIMGHFANEPLHREIVLHKLHWAKSPDYKIDFIIDKSSRVNSAYETLYKPALSLILSGAPDEDQDEVKKSFVDIIGSLVLLASPLSIIPLAKLLGVDTWSISSQVDPLRSVIDVPEDDSPLQLFHLSFRDYILSQSAGNLQVSETETQARLASRCLGLMRGTLKVDICGLLSPGKSHSDIEPSTIDEHLSVEIQRIHDDDDAYSFLQSFFTNWLEVLCLLRRVDDSLRMLQELQSLVDEASGPQVLQFIQDAIQFIRYFCAGIEETPLQIYHSGTIFSPRASIAPTPLEDRHYPDYIMQPSNIDPNWPQSQTLQVLDESLSQMAFLPDNKLASIGHLGELRIWDQRSLGWPDMIKIWNLDSGACLRSFPLTRCSGTETIAFSDDRKFICSICTRDLECVAFIHSLDTGKCVSEFEIPDKPSPILLSPKDWLVISLDNYRTLVLDMKTGAVSKTVCSYFKAGPVISDDGTLLAGQSLEGAVRVWDLTSRTLTDSTATEQPMGVELVTPFKDDNTILSHSWGKFKIWDMESAICKEELEPEVPLET
ncbi:Vegetative incompatibility protein HET-E-1 [Fusarium oxysporum f. sp. cubense race 1]|uniref:Vegetative incompatibility protein HET-E-1 n=1 Tax=Fusarium oxysporum f. sp. cubense (strain race 1) TaxID=1229664 RepID=N4UU19_FUSC1|nr:Vegetative incompatibility protein HET-E-1 [Fusarium oxysporum f. sp. cubense race 1]